MFIKGVWEYIEETRDKVRDLEQRVQRSKDNIEEIQKIMSKWSLVPLFERRETKNERLLHLDDREDRLNKRYNEISSSGEKLQELVKVLLCCMMSC